MIADLRRRQRGAHLRHVEREQLKRDELRGERLGGRDADFGTRMRIDRSLRLARRHAADDIADGDAVGALALCLAKRGKRIGGLA